MNDRSRSGITLLEVVVCIVLLMGLILFMIPAVTNAIHGDGYPQILSSGRGIYKQIFAAATENAEGSTNYWAASHPDTQYANYQPNSTDYFRWLMTEYDRKNPANGAGVLQQDFSAFHAPGLRKIQDLEALTPDTNPWVVVADLNERSTSGTPFMITRNVNETRLKEWRNAQEPLENVGTGYYSTPYGDEVLFVIRSGGGAGGLRREHFFWDILNPISATNRILNP